MPSTEPQTTNSEVNPNRQHLGEWLDLQVEELINYPDAIEQIYAGSLDGISIRGVFTEEEMSTGVLRARGYSDTFNDYGKQIFFGTAIVGADDDRADYYEAAPIINDCIDSLFDVDFVNRIGQVLSAVGGGRPASVPVEVGRGEYVPLTIRFLPPDGGVMHAHTANEFCNAWGSYEHLREIAQMWNSLSYFVVGQKPDSGGELVLYDLMWDDTPEDVRVLSMSEERDALLERFTKTPIDLNVGDMILFTGGRIWHRVEPVHGQNERVTIGGFAALSEDGASIYFWS
ncbi:MAG: hypothetical protein WD029_10500 [Microthrixaceae bacterium]